MATEGSAEDQVERGQQPDGRAGLIQARIVAPTDMSKVPTYYANYAQVGFSPHEFTLNFSRYSMPIVSEPPSETLILEVHPQPIASVSIPLNLIQGLIRALQGQVENWETTFHQAVPAEPSSMQSESRVEPSTAQGVDSQ